MFRRSLFHPRHFTRARILANGVGANGAALLDELWATLGCDRLRHCRMLDVRLGAAV